MKTHKPAIHISVLSLWLMALGILGLTLAPNSRAGLTGPYTNDFYTLHLWHLMDTNGTVPPVTNGVYFYDSQSNNSLVVPLLISNYVTAGNYDLSGQPGPGTGPLFQQLGTNYGYLLSVYATQSCGLFAPIITTGGTFPDLSYANTNNANSFVNTNTGAFTWEALIQPAFNPLTYTAIKNPEILCEDGGNSTPPGANPYTVRSVQLRLNNATPSSGKAELEFNGAISAPGGESHDVVGFLPTTGPDAVQQGQWYHAAVSFTGTSPTNGDPPYVLTLYWTKFDPTRTNADVLTNFNYFFTFTNTGQGTVYSLPYPSNSITGTAPFVIGNSARGLSGGNTWIGNIAEVRISDCYRHPGDFMFNTSPVGLPPSISGPTTNNLAGYGQTLNLNLLVSGSQPYSYQWYQTAGAITSPVAGQTNSSLVLSNIDYSANTNVYIAIVTNAYGSATSAVAVVTVGANLDALFNTGCGPNNNPLDQTAPGSVDLHWMFPPGGNPDNNSPNAIVWSDGGPLSTGGGVAPPNSTSVWVGPHENSSRVAGTYTLQTTFQVDETAVTGSNGISGTVGALAAQGGETIQMFLNGVETDVTANNNPAETTYAFTITNGLQPGSNILSYTAYQTGSGTAGNNGFNVAILTNTGPALTTAPAIINQPNGTTNIYGSTVSFQAVATGAPPLYSYWLSNGVAVTPPVWVFTAPPYLSFVATNFGASQLVGTDYLANYQVVFSNFLGSVTSTVANLDVQIPPPALTSAGVPVWSPTNSETNIVVYFSTAVDPVTATTAANYTVTGGSGATVLSAALGGSPSEVVLTTTVLSPTASYMLNVQNVESSFGIVINPSPSQVAVGIYPALALWLKANSGTVSDGSGGVGQWNDLSGNANNFMSAYGPSFDPILATGAGGYPVVRFNGSNDDTMYANNTGSLELTNDLTIFVVVNYATLAGNTNGEIISETDANNIPGPYDYYANSSAVVLLRGTGGGTPGNVASSRDPSIGVPHILDVVMQGNNVTHRLDGQPNGTGSMSTAIGDAGQPIQIGTRGDGAEHLTGDIYELLMVGSAMSPNDVASMENYLSSEYNISLIPSNPTNIVLSLANNQLSLKWPADHIGWTLQAQTNNLSVGIGTNWVNVSSSQGTNQVVVPINLTNGSVFYRLIYTP